MVKDASSEARKTIALAISSGCPTRFIGTVETRPAFLSALPVKRFKLIAKHICGARRALSLPTREHVDLEFAAVQLFAKMLA